jgi:SAM-dependent methyltransferase
LNYALAYSIGFHPWEDAEDQSSFVEGIAALLEHEEAGREPPYGRALDVGTGSGIWGIELARRGWQVTGVDLVGKALRRADRRVQKAGVEMRLVQGDVTALRDAGVGSGFDLVLDTGTFHGFDDVRRAAMGQEVSAITSDNATVLLLARAPKRRGPLPRGASKAEIEGAFPGWKVTEVGATGFEAPKPVELLLAPDERWYRLRRG